MKKYIIVGGIAGGASAAARLRRLDEKAKITLIDKGAHILSASCSLPYYIGGILESKEYLTYESPQNFQKRFNLDIRINTEVTNIRRHDKKVELRDMNTGKKSSLNYDKLILATGSVPVMPSIKGLKGKGIFTLRSIADTIAISEYIENNDIRRALVVGGGYIGLEAAENLAKRGINTSIVEASDHVLPIFDYDMAQFVEMTLEQHGISVVTGVSLNTLKRAGQDISLILSDGRNMNADIIIIGTGMAPEVSLAKKAGLGIGLTGGIIVDEHQQTTDKDIYAVGDAAEADCFYGIKALNSLASPATKQGRVAAENICGLGTKYKKTLGVTILKIFNTVFACAGLSEMQLSDLDVKYEKVYTRSFSHETFFPGASPITMKMMFDKRTGKIYGVQMAGEEGIDKRIDIMATAMRAGMTADKLADLELAYAPLFAEAKDAVNIIGCVASNVMTHHSEIIQWQNIHAGQSILLDVRPPNAYEAGTIRNAYNIPLTELRERLSELPKKKKIIVFCETGQQSYIAERVLKQNGFNVKNLSGGYVFI